MKKLLAVSLLVAVAAGAVIMLRPGDSVRITKAFTTARAAVEREDIDRLMKVFALGYRDEYGLTYLTVRRAFTDLFRRIDGIDAGFSARGMEIRGDTAAVVLDVWLTGREAGQRYRIVGAPGSPERLTVTCARGTLGWAIVRLKWQNVPSVEALIGSDFLQIAPVPAE
jgi:hypothetical protein